MFPSSLLTSSPVRCEECLLCHDSVNEAIKLKLSGLTSQPTELSPDVRGTISKPQTVHVLLHYMLREKSQYLLEITIFY